MINGCVSDVASSSRRMMRSRQASSTCECMLSTELPIELRRAPAAASHDAIDA